MSSIKVEGIVKYKPEFEIGQRVCTLEGGNIDSGIWRFILGIEQGGSEWEGEFLYKLTTIPSKDIVSLLDSEIARHQLSNIRELFLESEDENHNRRRDASLNELSELGYSIRAEIDGVVYIRESRVVAIEDKDRKPVIIEEKSK